MPKATFFNLSEDKRARFVEAALEEFAAHPYDQASVSRIVAALGIAKGSVYQYFDDKRDLFAWLLEEGGRRKLAAVTGTAPPEGADFFGRLRWLYLQGLLFQSAAPRWARLLLRAAEPSADPAIGAMAQQYQAMGQRFLAAELGRGQAEGDVRADVDVELSAHLVHGLLSDGLMRAFLAQVGAGATPEAVRSEHGRKSALIVIDAALALLSRGLSAR